MGVAYLYFYTADNTLNSGKSFSPSSISTLIFAKIDFSVSVFVLLSAETSLLNSKADFFETFIENLFFGESKDTFFEKSI